MSNSDIDDSIRDNLREGIRREVLPELVDLLVEVIDNYHGIDAPKGLPVARLRELRQEEENHARERIRGEIAGKQEAYRLEILEPLREELKQELLPAVREELKKELLERLFAAEEKINQPPPVTLPDDQGAPNLAAETLGLHIAAPPSSDPAKCDNATA
ncbi:MAG: hypothetical protein WCS31_00930 [Verrucomicrobiae bacterium]